MIVKPFNPDKIKNAKTREEKVGFENEKQTAYLLDFEFRNLKRAAVIHDIKLDYKGRTAQIDHLVITPTGIYVIESKFSSGTIKIDENNWIVEYNGTEKAFPSPIAQNDRHISVLRDLLSSEGIFPSKRFPELKSIIAIASSTIIKGKRPPEVMLAENIPSFIDKERIGLLTNPLKLAKTLINTYSENEDVELIAQKLLAFDVSIKLQKQWLAPLTSVEKETEPSRKLLEPEKKEKNLLYELKVVRTKLAKEHNKQMAHHVFSNETLKEMADKMPGSKEEMLTIYGVGEVKFEKYGAHFLNAIAAFKLSSVGRQ